jgi:hypothetical protein
MTDDADGRLDGFLSGMSEDRREFIKRVAKTTAFAAPLVASFAMGGLTSNPALAQVSCGNTTDSGQIG